MELNASPLGSTPILASTGADNLQRQREDEGLRDRLDGEFDRAVAGLVDVAVDGREADAEMRRIGLAQFRDVIGRRAAVFGRVGGQAVVQEVPQRRQRGRAGDRFARAL